MVDLRIDLINIRELIKIIEVGLCKHLTAVLSNKRWLQQVTSKLMDWLEENIDDVNAYLNLSGDKVLTLPNELARQNAKLRWQTKDNQNPDEDIKPEDVDNDNTDNIDNNNVQGNNPSTNKINNINNEEEEI